MPDPTNASSRSGSRLPVWKALLFALAPAVLLLLAAEGALWLVGVEPTSRNEDPFVGFSRHAPLFVESGGAEGTRMLETAAGKLAFFNMQRFSLNKPAGTLRIFTLGGSTTYGRPYDDATSFTGWLRLLLPAADPSRRYEVINAGGISYASYRVAALEQELAAYQPDLFIIYTGHNEYLEERTYGALRDLPESVKTSVSLLSRTRVWAALIGLARKVRGGTHQARDGRELLPGEVAAVLDHSAGPERYERDDALAAGILSHFRFSLRRMIATAREAGAGVILVVPASNLRDCSPFKSEHTPGLGQEELRRVADLADRAAADLAAGRADAALQSLDQALALDPRHAGLHFRRGQALLALQRPAEAVAALRSARQEDVCPLRALDGMQWAVREIGEEEGVPVVDYPALLEAASRDSGGQGIPGEDLFLDHVHPTIQAHGLLARALVAAMARRGIVKPVPGWGDAAFNAVAARIEAAVTPEMHARALGNLSMVLDWAGKKEESLRLAERALATGAEDATIFMMLARHASQQGRGEEALGFFRRGLRVSPDNPVLHSQVGLLLAGRGELEAAAAHLFLARLLWADNDVYRKQLAYAMQRRGRSGFDGALGPVATTRYESGYPRTIAQIRPGSEGTPIFDGIWTEWHDGGGLKGFADYADGLRDGVEVAWNSEGVEVARTLFRRGVPQDDPAGKASGAAGAEPR